MQIKIPPPKHYESYYGASDRVREFLNRIEKTAEEMLHSETIDILRISLLIASEEEFAKGKFLAYENFDWRCGYASVGVSGDFLRYHTGNDFDKICMLAEMLQDAFLCVGKKRKAKFNCDLANKIVRQITDDYMRNRVLL